MQFIECTRNEHVRVFWEDVLQMKVILSTLLIAPFLRNSLYLNIF